MVSRISEPSTVWVIFRYPVTFFPRVRNEKGALGICLWLDLGFPQFVPGHVGLKAGFCQFPQIFSGDQMDLVVEFCPTWRIIPPSIRVRRLAITVVVNHLLIGMMLQAVSTFLFEAFPSNLKSGNSRLSPLPDIKQSSMDFFPQILETCHSLAA